MDLLYNAARVSFEEFTYVIMLKDEKVCNICMPSGKVTVYNQILMPFDLYLSESDDVETRVNNSVNFYYWCSSRLLTLDRVHAKALLNSCGFAQARTDRERALIALQYRCLSLRDFYWVCKPDDKSNWNDINLFDNHMDSALVDISLKGKDLTVTNSELIATDLSTNGILPKAWIREQDGLYLLKGRKEGSIEREIRASNALAELGFSSVLYRRTEFYDMQVTMCKCFTNNSIAFISAGDYSMNNELVAVTNKFARQFAYLNLACYITGNSDLHQDNWGMLYSDNKEITGLAPIFDFDNCFLAKPDSLSLPMKLLGLSITQFESAKRACQLVDIDVQSLIDRSSDIYIRERLMSLQ